MQQQQQQYSANQFNEQQYAQLNEMQQEMLAMRGQYERDQMLLEQYDRRVKSLESELGLIGANVGAQMGAKDELIQQLQQQIEIWKNKYEALAKLYSQLRGEHLDLLNKSKGFQLRANSAQEAVDKMERMERDVKAKNLELADMIRERDRARYELDRIKSVSVHNQIRYHGRVPEDIGARLSFHTGASGRRQWPEGSGLPIRTVLEAEG
jgi:chromosome segregation ATPase